jgi:hypothetical protein
MVDIIIVNGGYFMVYKPTNITGGPHPVEFIQYDQQKSKVETWPCTPKPRYVMVKHNHL